MSLSTPFFKMKCIDRAELEKPWSLKRIEDGAARG